MQQVSNNLLAASPVPESKGKSLQLKCHSFITASQERSVRVGKQNVREESVVYQAVLSNSVKIKFGYGNGNPSERGGVWATVTRELRLNALN